MKVSTTHNNSKKVLEGVKKKKSHLLTRGLRATHKLGGLNVTVQNMTSINLKLKGPSKIGKAQSTN